MTCREHTKTSSSHKTPMSSLVSSALIAGILLTTAGFLLAFFWVAPVNGAEVELPELVGNTMVSHQQLLSQKIFYFHMPAAAVSFIALVCAAIAAIRFLMTRQTRFDMYSRVAMEIALLFVVFTMITGVLWTRFEWGVWWAWEPRLTTYLILMLIIIAYFVLRASLDDPEKKAVFAAVISIIALVDVPICFMITRLIPSSLHPVVLREGGMTPDMTLSVVCVLIGMMCIAFALYSLRVRACLLEERLETLKTRYEDAF